MKKGLLFCVLLLNTLLIHAQAPQFFNAFPAVAGTVLNNYPLGSTLFNKAQWIFGPNEFNAGGTGIGNPAYSGLITKIFLRLGNSVSVNPYTNFVISLSQNVGTNTTFGSVPSSTYTFVTGMTPCFTQSSGFTLAGGVANSWYGITLNSPFLYDSSKSLVVEIKVSGGSGNGIRLSTGGTTPKRLYGANSAGSGTNATGSLNFGIDIQSVLPVSLINFDGFKDGHMDVLKWSTSSETNNACFNIQHSSDGEHFATLETIGSKAPNGNSSTPLDYVMRNVKPVNGHNYYRLQQVDINGAISLHSKIVDLLRTADGSEIILYPNPAKNLVTLDLNSNEFSTLTIRINDMNGRIVKEVKSSAQPGSNQIPLDIYQLRSGNYMLQVKKNDELIFTSKMTKE